MMELAVFGKSMSLHKEIIIATDGAWDEMEKKITALTCWSYGYTLLGNNSYNNNNSKEEERDQGEQFYLLR